MGTRVIYVHNEHQEIWDKAIELAGEVSVSSLLTSTLQQLIRNLERVTSYERFKNVVLRYGEGDEGSAISFQGFEITRTPCDNQIAYLTSKGKFLVYVDSEDYLSTYYIYHSLAEMANEKDVFGRPVIKKELIHSISEEMDIEYIEELDV